MSGYQPAETWQSEREGATERNRREGFPVANVANLDEALVEASWICFASHSLQAVIYCTTDDMTADPETGERYLVFREDDPTRFHLNPEQGWRESYTITGKRSQ